MTSQDDALPDCPWKRFAWGFSIGAAVTFICVFLYSSRFSEGAADGGAAALLVGIPAGVISAFGKKALRWIIALASEVLSSP